MIIIGLNRHHNGNACILEDGKIIYSTEEERLNRVKYEGSPFLNLLQIKELAPHIDGVAIAGFDRLVPFEKYTNVNYYEMLFNRLYKNQKFINRTYDHLHHLTHAAGAFYNSGFKEAISVVFDGDGSLWKDGIEKYSAFHCKHPYDINLLEKEFFDYDEPYSKTNTLSLGNYFAAIADHLGMNPLFDAGKVMALASYGKNIIEDFDSFFDHNYFIEPRLVRMSCLNQNHPMFEKTRLGNDFQASADLALTVQTLTENIMIKKIHDLIDNHGIKNICLSGGYALNCVANFKLRQSLPKDITLYIEPVSHDAGTAIGAAKLLYHEMRMKEGIKDDPIIPQTTVKYGFQNHYPKSYDFARFTKTKVTNKDVAKKLSENKIVAMFKGKSELGPRALGNRSILFNPNNSKAKDIVNKVKNREFYRPFAGTILHEDCKQYFDMNVLDESPFMMYAVKAKNYALKGIRHVDGTCRIQTLKKEQDYFFYDLIKEFKQITNIPCLLNTSFNLSGEPMVETLDDAVKTFENSDIDCLYLPELYILLEK